MTLEPRAPAKDRALPQGAPWGRQATRPADTGPLRRHSHTPRSPGSTPCHCHSKTPPCVTPPMLRFWPSGPSERLSLGGDAVPREVSDMRKSHPQQVPWSFLGCCRHGQWGPQSHPVCACAADIRHRNLLDE